MTPERMAQILGDTDARDGRRRTMHQAFVDVVTHDWQADARREFDEFLTTSHGKRLPKAERDRIRREIEAEHRDKWRTESERALTLAGYAAHEETPSLEAYLHECSAPPTAAEAYDHAVSDRGSPDRPLMLALLEQVTRRDIRRELATLPPTAALEFYRRAVDRNGVTPDAIVRRAVLIQEVERRSTWEYDAKGEHATVEHAATMELAKLVNTTKASRVPQELRAAIDAAQEAHRYAERMKTIHKLQLVPLADVLGEGEGA